MFSISILSAITRDKIVANQLIEGGVTGVLYENFLFKALLELRNDPKNAGKDIVVFMDNARIHKHPVVM